MLRRWLPIGLTVATLALVIFLAGPGRVIATLTGARWSMLAVAACFTPVVLALRAARWWLLARRVDPTLAFSRAWSSYMGGLTLAVMTPLAAGELGRGALLERGDRVALASLTLLDKLADLAWIGILGPIGMGVVFPEHRLMLTAEASLPIWSLAALVPVAFVLARTVGSRIGERLTGRLRRAAQAATTLPLDLVAGVFVLSGLGFGVFLCQAWFTLLAVDPDAPLSAIALWPAITLSTIVPAFAGGVGPREATAAVLLPQVGVTASAGASAAFLQYLVVMVLPALFGARRLGEWRRRAAAGGSGPDSVAADVAES